MTPIETLEHIQNRLTSESPSQIIEAMLPRAHSGAVTWARRLSGWQEYPFPDQVIGLARVISRRAMTEFGLKLTDDGRVLGDSKDRRPQRTFLLSIAGEELSVEYTPRYLPDGHTSLFYFTNASLKPHCLSQTGYLSQFVPADVVDACGGAEAFALRFAEATIQGTGAAFMATFEGERPETKRSRKKSTRTESHPPLEGVIGEHTSRALAGPEPDKQSVQGLLF